MKLVFVLCCILAADVSSGVKPDRPCPLIKCAMACEFGTVKNGGCPTCKCYNPCENTTCPLDQECVAINRKCVGCPPKTVCVPKACLLKRCDRYCKSGYRVDENDCPTCECVNPCEYPPCAKNETCISKEVVCVKAPCYPVPECTVCPVTTCPLLCKSGYRLDDRGCQTCECVDPCEYPKCTGKAVCVRQEVFCKRDPCYPTYQCIDKRDVCPLMKCRECKSGYREVNGCPSCDCVDPCEYPKCDEGQICQKVVIQCFRDPCYPLYKCVNDCPQIMCFVPCVSGYRNNSRGCQTCECVDPCEYPKCEPNEICVKEEPDCPDSSCYPGYKCLKKACPLLKCLPCSTGFKRDKDGCPTCECITPKTTPCMTMRCAKGFKCIEVVNPCLIPPCPVRGECVPTTTA